MRLKNGLKTGLAGLLLTFAALLAGASIASADSGSPAEDAQQTPGIAERIAGFFNRLANNDPSFIWPVADGQITSRYGMRLDPILGTWHLHSGVDFAAPSGTPIMAAADGVVISAEWETGYGYTTRIQHDNGVETTYAHQRHIEAGIVPGARVTEGEVIGEVGATGYATGPHLHFEVAIDGVTVDPLGDQAQRVGIVANFNTGG